MNTKERIAAFRAAQGELNAELDSLLYAAGWKRSALNPSCLWFWEKNFPEGIGRLTLSSEQALQIEEDWQEQSNPE